MLRTHRQRVPAMLAVATVGMLVYAVAGAAPDGRVLAPASCAPASGPPAPGCFETAAAAPKDAAPKDDGAADDKGGDKGSTTTTTKCDPKTGKAGSDGKDGKDGAPAGGGKAQVASALNVDKNMSTAAAAPADDKGDADGKGDDKGSTTTTTEKGGDGKGDGDGKGSTTTTTEKGGKGDDDGKGDGDGKDDCGSTTTTTRKGDGGGKGDGDGKDTTTTTRKGGGGKDSTTTTTEKGGKGDDDKGNGATTTTTTQRGTVEPQTPPPDTGGDGMSQPGDSPDPGGAPIEPQEAPPFEEDFDSDPGPAADNPEDAADPGPGDFDMWDDDETEVAYDPIEAPGSGAMMPVINDIAPSKGKAARERSRDRSNRSSVRGTERDSEIEIELAAPPVATPRTSSAPGVTESARVSRRLAGMQTSSVTESAFPASIISTPNEFPVNHRDPLAAAALVVLLGVSRELFKVWRRRATDYWPA